jgi:hypothetical protein
MSLLALKQQITRLSPSERRELNVYMVRLRNESEEWQETLQDRMHEMDQGQKVTQQELAQRLREKHGEEL